VDGEYVDHLLIHGPLAKVLWDTVFALFGVQWVMLRRDESSKAAVYDVCCGG
jgi:hypothetical protein